MEIFANYDELLPKGILFSIKEIDDMGLIKSDMLKKLIYNREIEVVKVGTKNFISRSVLILFLKKNTLPALK
ncbi:MAG: DNA-binding protein [Campylobacter sp.]|uniref:DNA-binding protein n=1 Tax=Campylobacter TaxID=194 RepID=UPI002361E480|nr:MULTISPECIES: DNA-binding protein [Campylobacter]MDD7599970.1 DNA-binding protein [Campylobacteraceae bacterium]MCI7236403.1 DNA-binding protein [Campylobacter sp.]MCI7549413.1 DNA-binding protein [Campylobacter sp.]MCI7581266.1 DNA-binding protein [Campylobacter sp.]MDD0848777.1 DNA-binding protein [Campylobacter magnus]